jgi:hypothetical protein
VKTIRENIRQQIRKETAETIHAEVNKALRELAVKT